MPNAFLLCIAIANVPKYYLASEAICDRFAASWILAMLWQVSKLILRPLVRGLA